MRKLCTVYQLGAACPVRLLACYVSYKPWIKGKSANMPKLTSLTLDEKLMLRAYIRIVWLCS